MGDPLFDVDVTAEVLRQVSEAAGPYLDSLAKRPAYDPGSADLLAELSALTPDGGLPEQGVGTAAAAERLLRVGTAAATHSAGPRYFHFVIGGATPAALAADWTTSLLDQNAAFRTSSLFAAEVERITLRWLRELFGLPETYGGALVGSATFANFTSLAVATHWWAERHGVDVAANGLAGLPRMPVLSGGYVHASIRKALQMLGHGRDTVEVHAADRVGRVDLAAIERRLAELDGPAVLVASAGEVNAGDFDPIEALADLAERYGAWLHVDGAFGLFAALSPRTAHLVRGVDRADSIACDGHKWLNVPYESGFAFVREPARLAAAFGMPGSTYLPGPGSPLWSGPEQDRPDPARARAAATSAGPGDAAVPSGPLDYSRYGPESSRRARAMPIWATLAAYGRDGYRAMVERQLDLAQRLARLVDAAPELERLAEVPLCIVCFRARPEHVPAEALDDLNRRLGAALLDDGRVVAGTTVYDGRVALRPAIVNWRTTEADIDLLVEVVRDLVARLAPAPA
ncbi:pyridoxal-dependent decarboxylase [Micromonospora sp. HM5-17]|uniref:pyridoxal phosphate-dependent decarboxylase family protein n=1 Tax=Micromonospora sp. HM5-17 TaxID=2487710 RepID=UPI000F475A96|nr:pyridoxal-dependent decarboxylase [Micromonospora sp. HM5-17]ROT31369.1 aspartate aminotransferase family protein [Micromonospora sp. HM5-17]